MVAHNRKNGRCYILLQFLHLHHCFCCWTKVMCIQKIVMIKNHIIISVYFKTNLGKEQMCVCKHAHTKQAAVTETWRIHGYAKIVIPISPWLLPLNSLYNSHPIIWGSDTVTKWTVTRKNMCVCLLKSHYCVRAPYKIFCIRALQDECECAEIPVSARKVSCCNLVYFSHSYFGRHTTSTFYFRGSWFNLVWKNNYPDEVCDFPQLDTENGAV